MSHMRRSDLHRVAPWPGLVALGKWRRQLRPLPRPAPESIHAVTTDPEVVTDKARGELGYAPRPLAETVEDLYASLREQGLLE